MATDMRNYFPMGFSTYAVATMLGVSARRVRGIADDLNIKPKKFGGSLIFTKTQVDKMRRRKTKPGPKEAARQR